MQGVPFMLFGRQWESRPIVIIMGFHGIAALKHIYARLKHHGACYCWH